MDYFNEDGNGQCGAWVVGKKGAHNKISLMQLNHLPNFFNANSLQSIANKDATRGRAELRLIASEIVAGTFHY